MSRVKRGVMSMKRRRNVLRAAKGFRNARSSKEAQAKVALRKAGVHAFAHRRDRKSDFRRLWQIRISAALKPMGYSFSKFIGTAIKKNIALDRKILSTLAQQNPETFSRIAAEVMK